MKIFNCLLLVCHIIFPSLFCLGMFHQNGDRSSEITTQIGPSKEDKEILQEALHLLNMGKKTLGLSTVNPLQVIQLVSNSSAKETQIRRVLQKPLNNLVSNSEQYMVLSGRNGHLQLVNFTNTTFPSEEVHPNNSVIEDMFKITMEKKSPEKTGKGKLFHKITIIETNQQKPFDQKQFPRHVIIANRPLKRYKMSSANRALFLPRIRQKRMKYKSYELENPKFNTRNDFKSANEEKDSIHFDAISENSKVPLRRQSLRSLRHFLSLDYPKSDKIDAPQLKKISFLEEYGKIDSNQEYSGDIRYSLNLLKMGETDGTDKSSKEDNLLDELNLYRKKDFDPQYSDNAMENRPLLDARMLLSMENDFINRILRLIKNVRSGEERVRSFQALAIIILLLAVLTLLVFILYRKWRNSFKSRTRDRKGANVLVKLRECMEDHFYYKNGLSNKLYDAPFNRAYYQLVATDEPVELEWQSENGDWLSDQDVDEKQM